MNISDLLLCERANAIPLRQLQVLTGMGGRMILKLIEAERRSGVPVLADNKTGYFLPENETERDNFIQSIRHRANEIRLTTAAIERGDGKCTNTSRQS